MRATIKSGSDLNALTASSGKIVKLGTLNLEELDYQFVDTCKEVGSKRYKLREAENKMEHRGSSQELTQFLGIAGELATKEMLTKLGIKYKTDELASPYGQRLAFDFEIEGISYEVKCQIKGYELTISENAYKRLMSKKDTRLIVVELYDESDFGHELITDLLGNKRTFRKEVLGYLRSLNTASIYTGKACDILQLLKSKGKLSWIPKPPNVKATSHYAVTCGFSKAIADLKDKHVRIQK